MFTLENITNAWHRSIVPAARDISIPVATLLQETRPIWLSEDNLGLMTDHQFHWECLNTLRARQVIWQAVAEVTGESVGICVYSPHVQQPKTPQTKYDQYLRGEHWKHMRVLALSYYGHSCVLCGSKDDLNVHHRTYERKGAELLSDLTVLCRTCHKRFHDK